MHRHGCVYCKKCCVAEFSILDSIFFLADRDLQLINGKDFAWLNQHELFA